MRFDPERVIRHAADLPAPRGGGADGAPTEADDLAAHLAAAGLEVRRVRGAGRGVSLLRRGGPESEQVIGTVPTAAAPDARVVIVTAFRRPSEGPSIQGDNRTGLAMLAELARTWPHGLGDRVECTFAASNSVPALLRLLLTPADVEADRTLAITLDAPGVGSELTILGHNAGARLTLQAARDLWLPHRAAGVLWRRLGHDAYRFADVPHVSLCGARDDRPIDPAYLAATAQLVCEAALRWAKGHAADQPVAVNEARSSQNRG